MQKTSLFYIAGLLLLLTAGVYSCKKVNGIDNETVIATPYYLYFGDTSGAVFNSTDGRSFNTIFPPDGKPTRAICVAYDKVLFIKDNAYVSYNNGKNFNHSLDSVSTFPTVACNGLPIDLNQSMVLNAADWGKIYITTNDADAVKNTLGLAHSTYAGERGYWYYEKNDSEGAMGILPIVNPGIVHVTSFTRLANGVLCAYDAINNRNFYKTDNNTVWKETTANPTNDPYGIGAPWNMTGTALPHVVINSTSVTTDTTARYSLGHYNNRLIAIDQKNCNSAGAYYSDDTGRNWTAYTGLPLNTPLLCIASPFEQICLIGTYSGLYKLNVNTGVWEKNNNGLTGNLIVRNIAFKENIYKNGIRKKYVYLATNLGIFQSLDGGINWTKTISGNYITIY